MEKENRHFAEHLRQQVEDDPAQAQGGMSSGSNQAPETVSSPMDLLPSNPAEDNPIPVEDLEPAPTNAPSARDASASPPDDNEHATGASAPDTDHGVAAGDMELDLVLH